LKKIIPVPKTLRKYSNAKIGSFSFITEEANSIEEKPKNQKGNKVRGHRYLKCK